MKINEQLVPLAKIIELLSNINTEELSHYEAYLSSHRDENGRLLSTIEIKVVIPHDSTATRS